MKITAKEICNLIKGEIFGNSNIIITSFNNIQDSQEGDITFVSNNQYLKYIHSTQASVIITPKLDINTNKTIIKVTDPVKKFSEIVDIFNPKKNRKIEISESAKIGKNCTIGRDVLVDHNCIIEDNVKIGDNCSILPNTFIGNNVIIKKNSQIGPNVSIYNNCNIGNKCIIHAGVVIGSDGFGFASYNGTLSKMPQVGKVIINDNVEIGANTTIDRGTINDTEIDQGVKLDNLIQIGHNVKIGKNTVIAAQCGIAGSTQIGENCMIGGQVAIADHIKIGNNVKIAGKSGVIKNVKDNQIIQGPLAFEIKEFQKSYIHFKNLDSIISDFNQLKKNIDSAKNNKK